VVQSNQEIDVKILRVDREDRKIGLSLKRAQWGAGDDERPERKPSAPSPARGGMDEHSALGTNIIKLPGQE